MTGAPDSRVRCVAHPDVPADKLCPTCSDWRCEPCQAEGCERADCPLRPEQWWRDHPAPLEVAPGQWTRTAPITLARLWSDPVGFFARLPAKGPAGPPLAVALCLGTVPWLATLVGLSGRLQLWQLLWALLPLPLLDALRLGWTATLTQLLLQLLGHGHRPRHTLRWVSYAATLDVLGVVPWLGAVLVSPLGALWRALAVRHHLGLPWWQAVVVALFPTGAGWLVGVAIVTLAAWWTGITF